MTQTMINFKDRTDGLRVRIIDRGQLVQVQIWQHFADGWQEYRHSLGNGWVRRADAIVYLDGFLPRRYWEETSISFFEGKT